MDSLSEKSEYLKKSASIPHSPKNNRMDSRQNILKMHMSIIGEIPMSKNLFLILFI
jgi:hypothetical protein